MLLTRSMSIQSDVSREIFIQKRDGAHSNTERYYGLWLVEVQDYETIGMLCIRTNSKNFLNWVQISAWKVCLHYQISGTTRTSSKCLMFDRASLSSDLKRPFTHEVTFFSVPHTD